MIILGVNMYHADSSAAIFVDGKLIAAFPVLQDDEIMLVTDGGQLIRCPVGGIRIAGRGTQGVIVFNTAEDERVVSVEHIGDVGAQEDEE